MTTTSLMSLIVELYRDEGEVCLCGSGATGGHLHICLDDGNMSDADVYYCLDSAVDAGCAPCTSIARRLLPMSVDDREALFDDIAHAVS